MTVTVELRCFEPRPYRSTLMRMSVARSLLSLIVAGSLSAAARAENWTGPKDVARSAHEFAVAAEKLQKFIKDVNEDSPLAAEIRALSKSASLLHDSVEKGGTYEDAKKAFRKIESDYAHFEAGLKKAHDVHHEKPVEDASKIAKTKFERLQAHMSGRRPVESTAPTSPRPAQEDH
jgi:1,4-alpha-glucan branching enzyme